jgi:basic amino acid/polyamine antiporter, APA family
VTAPDGRQTTGTPAPELARLIGRWGLLGLAVNGVLGSGIFGLPATVAAAVGSASPWTVLLAGGAMGVIVACYAEAASQFTESGGTYLYVRRALGRLAGIQVGWMMLLVRLTACAAGADLFVDYLAGFVPDVLLPVPRFVAITILFGILTTVNYRGVRAGTAVSTLSVAAKLIALGMLCATGAVYLLTHPAIPQVPSHAPIGHWLNAILLLFFAYGGYEMALNAGGEVGNSRRDAPFAVLGGLLLVTLLYTTLQLIVIHLVADAGRSARPLADSARVIAGPAGALLVSAAALLSVFGFLSATMLGMPRSLYALGESGDFPAWFAQVHPRFRTPYLSILAFALPAWLAALFGSFSWNVTLSSVGRLVYFAAVCAAVPALRKTRSANAAFRVPGGALAPCAGIVICAVLLTRADLTGSVILAATIAIGVVNWLVVKD